MKILFINDYHLPQVYRGTELSTHALCTTLREAGQEVAVLARLTAYGVLGLWSRAKLKLDRRKAWVVDRAMGYPTYCAWQPRLVLAEVIGHWRPDVLVYQAGDRALAGMAVDTGLPTFVYFRVRPDWDDVPDPRRTRFITNSLFCHKTIKEKFQVESQIIRPLILENEYRTQVTRKYVTSVGVSFDKGTDVVLDIASALPQFQFNVFSNYIRPSEQQKALLHRARGIPNLRILPLQRSGKKIYRNTRVLLAPSRWLETWGRVVTEAQVNDIPALASNRGGLPEAVGPGGLCLPLDAPIGEWTAALRRMMEDDEAYAQYQRGIREHKASRELSPAGITADFLKTIGA
jgi:glycosyltransferase involved in cell wall biosynthesis